MDRVGEIALHIKAYQLERIERKKVLLAQHLNQMLPSLRPQIKALVEEQVYRQKNMGQERIKHLFFCRLISSSYTGSYEMAIGMSNAMLYIDKNVNYVYWIPDAMYGGIGGDRAEVEKLIRTKFIRLEEFELQYIMRKLIYDDWSLFRSSIGQLAENVSDLIIDSPLLLEEEVTVLSGDYMGRQEVMCSIVTERSVEYGE